MTQRKRTIHHREEKKKKTEGSWVTRYIRISEIKQRWKNILDKDRDQLWFIYSEIKTKGKHCSCSEKNTDLQLVQFQGELLWKSV